VPDEKKGNVTKPKVTAAPEKRHVAGPEAKAAALTSLQQTVGNQAVQRLLAARSGAGHVQRSGEGAFELDDDTANRIDSERGGGKALDGSVQAQASGAMEQDFSDVRVHTSSESDELNQQLGAKAFTTGQDVFFREGAYQPNTTSGQELIAHELTHVAQQSSGRVSSSGGMTVNAPGDTFEREADSVAKAFASPGAGADLQRQELEEEMPEPEGAPEEVPEEEEAV